MIGKKNYNQNSSSYNLNKYYTNSSDFTQFAKQINFKPLKQFINFFRIENYILR